MELYTLHLFSGAGGGILADILLGHRPVGAVEIEEHPRKVLLQRQLDGHLPRFPIWDDVRTFRADNPECAGYIERLRGIADKLCICGGFPCQDISAAGHGAGIDGERSGLWGEYARIIGEVRPAYAFVENSPMLTIRGLHRVVADLARVGYDAEWCCVGAGDIGALHQRKRIWILAAPHSSQVGISRRGVKTFQGERAFSWCKDVRGREDFKVGFHLPEPILLRTQHDVADYVDRIKAIGNGQVPALAKLAWRILTQ